VEGEAEEVEEGGVEERGAEEVEEGGAEE